MRRSTKGQLKYLRGNYCGDCGKWVWDKSILRCPECHDMMRIGNGQSKKRHGVKKISGVTGTLAATADEGIP